MKNVICNEQMAAGRYLRMYRGRKRMKAIVSCLGANGRVVIPTAYRATVYSAKHVSMFRLGSSGALYVQRGRNWDCLDFSVVICQQANGREDVYQWN